MLGRRTKLRWDRRIYNDKVPQGSPQHIILAENLTKVYAAGRIEVAAVRGVSLAVEPGEFVAIVGPSGSGKSTLFYLLGGLTRASGGRVAIVDAGIVPMITLHHFAHPQWFEDMGAFEKEENIAYFVRFAQTVFSRLGSKVQFWCTINEPSIVVLQGYLRGVFPPGKGNIVTGQPLATKVLRNLMQAHAETYKALKAMPGGPDAQIRLVHQYLKFESYTCWNPLEFMGPLLTNTLLNDTILEFLKTGTFTFGKRFIFNETYTAEGPLTDFIGLNYYSRAVIAAQWPNWSTFEVGGSCYPGEVMTDMPYAIYPKGLYDAIKDVAQIGVPIYITENGIADKNNTNDTRRVQWFRIPQSSESSD